MSLNIIAGRVPADIAEPLAIVVAIHDLVYRLGSAAELAGALGMGRLAAEIGAAAEEAAAHQHTYVGEVAERLNMCDRTARDVIEGLGLDDLAAGA